MTLQTICHASIIALRLCQSAYFFTSLQWRRPGLQPPALISSSPACLHCTFSSTHALTLPHTCCSAQLGTHSSCTCAHRRHNTAARTHRRTHASMGMFASTRACPAVQAAADTRCACCRNAVPSVAAALRARWYLPTRVHLPGPAAPGTCSACAARAVVIPRSGTHRAHCSSCLWYTCCKQLHQLQL